MKRLYLFVVVFFLISLISSAQKIVLKSIHVKSFELIFLNNNKQADTVYRVFTLDSLGYKQGQFIYHFNGIMLQKCSFKNDILVDSCIWYTQEGDVLAKGKFVYKNDYGKTVGVNVYQYSKNHFAYLNDTIIVYNNPSDRMKPSILVYSDNLKNGTLFINSKDGYRNIFTYQKDTLNGYFQHTFISNAKYNKELFCETGNYWHGKNSYDDWYYKYQIREKDSILIQKTLYRKNIKHEEHTYYNLSGNKECSNYYSTNSYMDSSRCNHEQGSLKSIIQYDKNGIGIQYTYNGEGQLIKKASYYKGMLYGNVYEYQSGFLVSKATYRNDTILERVNIQNTIIWQRIYYLNGRVEKVEFFDNKGRLTKITSSEHGGNMSHSDLDKTTPENTAYVSTSIEKKKKTLSQEEFEATQTDLVLCKTLPVDHVFYSDHYYNYSSVFVISKLVSPPTTPYNVHEKLLRPLQDSLLAYSKTKKGAPLSKLKDPLYLVLSLSLLDSDTSCKHYTSIHLNEIKGTAGKKITAALEFFFATSRIPLVKRYNVNEYLECSYTLYPIK